MKTDTPHDIQGRMIAAWHRAAAVGAALRSFAQAQDEGFSDVEADALYGLGDMAEELAAELQAIEAENTRQEHLIYNTIKTVSGAAASQTVLNRMADEIRRGAR